tara:strand:+ start:82 stop:615 length:534 start_codon:yes stop_codon:yes gene_type:complete
MTSQELSNMIYNIKEKLTDIEYKEIMDTLAIKNKNEENMYEVRYIKQKRKLTYGDGGGLFYKIEPIYKVKNVKIPDGDEGLKTFIDELIELIKDKKMYKIPPIDVCKIKGEYYFSFCPNPVLWCNNPYQQKCNCKDCNSDDDDEDECEDERAKEKGCFIGFRHILIVSIEKKENIAE